MKYVFSELLKEVYTTSGHLGVLNLWIRTLIDAGKTILTQQLDNQKGGLSMKSKHILRVAMVTAAILMVPLLAMQFTREVNWTLSDFIIMGALIFGTGLLIEFANIKIKKKNHRLFAIAGIVLVFLWIWVELAVGLFTNLGS